MTADSLKITAVDFCNYKAFKKFTMSIERLNILVAPNNSGKSTIIGAFRALETALRRARSRKPDVLEGPRGRVYGYSIAADSIPISIENVHTDYADTDTTVTFQLSNDTRLQLFFPADGGCLLIPYSEKKWAPTPSGFRDTFPISVVVVPVLGPVEHNEELLHTETVQRNLGTHRASRNFRNYWYYFPEGFDEFATLVAETWPGMSIQRPELASGFSSQLVMYSLEHRMTRELFWSGFGFQVWCQLLTHVHRAKTASIFVVDEPDVYLHSDLQLHFLAMLRTISPDVLIATHSAEIIGDADPHELVVINKTKSFSQRLKDVEGVQTMLDRLGSIQNIVLTRAARNGTLLFTEEDADFAILRGFARQLGFRELASGSGITKVVLKGGAPQEGISTLASGIKALVGHALRIAVVLDGGDKCEEERRQILGQLSKQVELAHIYQRRAVANYLLVPSVLTRAVRAAIADRTSRTNQNVAPPDSIDDLLSEITSGMKGVLRDQYVTARTNYIHQTGTDLESIRQDTLNWFERKWSALDRRMEIVWGRETLDLLRERLQERFGIVLTDQSIISEFQVIDIPRDITSLLTQLDNFKRSHRAVE